MRIAIDVSCLASNGRGFARYVQALLLGFSEAGLSPKDLRLFSDSSLGRERIPEAYRPALRVLGPRRFHALWRSRDLVAAARREGASLLHFPDNAVADTSGMRAVSTVHDLAALWFPHLHLASSLARIHFARSSESIRRWADLVLTDSEAARNDLSSFWKGKHPPLRTVHPALVPLTPSSTLGSKAPYFLFVGALERRKNLSGLAVAFARFRTSTGLPHELRLAGEIARGPAVRAEVPRGPGIRLLGRVGDAELATLYAGATALILPSWYEAFGFPCLEAMAYDCPVLASTAGAGPEIVGDAGLLADPADPEGLAQAMGRLARDPELGRDLARRGRERLKRFSLRRMGEETLEAYRSCAASPVS